MNLYRLKPSTEPRESYVEFPKKDAETIFKFFILGIGSVPGDKIFSATSQSGLTPELLRTLDFFNAIIGVPIFSKKFYETVGPLLSDEIDFYPLKIDQHENFYLGRINPHIQIIDYERSEYFPLSDPDDVPLLYTPTYLNEFSTAFNIARDIKEETYYAVSEQFKIMAETKNLNIGFQLLN